MIEVCEVLLSEDIANILTPEQVKKLELKINTLYLVKGTIELEEVTEEFIKKHF